MLPLFCSKEENFRWSLGLFLYKAPNILLKWHVWSFFAILTVPSSYLTQKGKVRRFCGDPAKSVALWEGPCSLLVLSAVIHVVPSGYLRKSVFGACWSCRDVYSFNTWVFMENWWSLPDIYSQPRQSFWNLVSEYVSILLIICGNFTLSPIIGYWYTPEKEEASSS